MAHKAFQTKLKLNNSQSTLMAQHAGFGRWVWNWALRLWGEAYREGLKPNAAKLKKLFTSHIKPQYQWMSELSSRVYQYSFEHLSDAFNRFFKGLAKYPNFKKKGLHDSFTLDATPRPIKLGGLRHKLPFFGWVQTHEALPDCQTKKVTISREADGCIRKDALHKLTTYLAKNHGSVVIEDLHVAGMMKNHQLAGAIADAAFGEFRRQLEYKCQWYGSKLVVVDRFFPSSQLCSRCNHQQKMPLKVRTYDCPKCGLSIDRDLNASINLENAVG